MQTFVVFFDVTLNKQLNSGVVGDFITMMS